MSPAQAMFQSELRAAVRDAQGAAPPAGHRRAGKRARLWLWLPLTPLWILLAPFALLVVPVLVAVLPITRGAPPFRTTVRLGAALIAMSGLVVDVDGPNAAIRIRIF